MFNEKHEKLYFKAWIRLLCTYLLSFAGSFLMGVFMVKIIKAAPETIFDLSTKRLSYVVPILQGAEKIGIDQGILLFAWNTLGAVVTISFLYTAKLFNPLNINRFPQALRKVFCGRKPMTLLCYLPGCLKIKEEPLRRVYVWLMVPWLGMLLLGIESGLTVSTSSYTLGSYFIGFVSLLPHGIIEIPAFALAGAVAFSAHYIVKEKARKKTAAEVFDNLRKYSDEVPLPNIIAFVTLCLFFSGLVEGHITQELVKILMK